MFLFKERIWEPQHKRFHYPEPIDSEFGIVSFDSLYYEGDIVVGEFGYINTGIGIVRFGEWEQDGSGGEYSSSPCYGFYVERMRILLPDWEDPDDAYGESYYKTVSILDFKFDKIGNIHENPELVNEYEKI